MSSNDPGSSAPPSASAGADAPAPAAAAAGAPTAGATSTTTGETTTTTATTKAKPKKKSTAKKATGAGTKAKSAKKPSATTKRKRPAAKKKETISADTILAEGQAAAQDLAQQRAAAAQRRTDPLWYRMEDVLPPKQSSDQPPNRMCTSSSSVLPEQVVLVERALQHAGLHGGASDVTPQALACLLEQARRYASELLAHAADYAYTAGRPEIAPADLRLARELGAPPSSGSHNHNSSMSDDVSTQLPKLHLMAQTINRAPLPSLPAHCYSGIVLPDAAHQLTARTFDVVSTARLLQKRVQPLPASPAQQQQAAATTAASVGYGATRGRQIPIVLKDRAGAEEGGGPVPMDTSPTTTTTTTTATATSTQAPAASSAAPTAATPMDETK